jgi:hypothetical protein
MAGGCFAKQVRPVDISAIASLFVQFFEICVEGMFQIMGMILDWRSRSKRSSKFKPHRFLCSGWVVA